jgi:hypothetical protein
MDIFTSPQTRREGREHKMPRQERSRRLPLVLHDVSVVKTGRVGRPLTLVRLSVHRDINGSITHIARTQAAGHLRTIRVLSQALDPKKVSSGMAREGHGAYAGVVGGRIQKQAAYSGISAHHPFCAVPRTTALSARGLMTMAVQWYLCLPIPSSPHPLHCAHLRTVFIAGHSGLGLVRVKI